MGNHDLIQTVLAAKRLGVFFVRRLPICRHLPHRLGEQSDVHVRIFLFQFVDVRIFSELRESCESTARISVGDVDNNGGKCLHNQQPKHDQPHQEQQHQQQ